MCVVDTHSVLKCYFKDVSKMSRKGYCVTISRESKSKLLRDYFIWEQTDCGLTMQVSGLTQKSKPNMVAGPSVSRNFIFFLSDFFLPVCLFVCCCKPPKILTLPPKKRTQICMDLNYIDTPARVLNYCYK